MPRKKKPAENPAEHLAPVIGDAALPAEDLRARQAAHGASDPAGPVQESLDTHGALKRAQARLQQMHLQRERLEAAEKARAASPLSLCFEIVSCQFASEHYTDEKMLPSFTFDSYPCPFGKQQPDQDCRECAHVKYVRYGLHLPLHSRRYIAQGLVIPLTEAQADAVAETLSRVDAQPLTRLAHQITHATGEVVQLQAAYEREQNERIAAQQGAL